MQENNLAKTQAFNLIKDVNMMVTYKYTDEELAKWVQTIFRLFDYVKVETLVTITDNFLTGEEDFDKNIGILNYTIRIARYSGR